MIVTAIISKRDYAKLSGVSFKTMKAMNINVIMTYGVLSENNSTR